MLLSISAVLSLLLTPVVRRLATRLGVVDAPGERKVHLHPVPRLGGVGVAASAALGLAMLAWLQPTLGSRAVLDARELLPIIAGAALVFAAGLWDDARGAPVVVKLAIQSSAAALVIASGIAIERVTVFGSTQDLGALAIPVTLLWIVGLTNAFNLMDGLDGLAAGLAAIAAATCATILVVRGHHQDALLLVALLGATVGFLPYNFHPASIFLGDAGSLLFGFALAVTAITGWQKGATALAVGVPLLIFALPIVETASSIARRLRRGAANADVPRLAALGQVFEADQQHIHHRLLAGGLSHRGAVLLLYGLALGLSGLALLTI